MDGTNNGEKFSKQLKICIPVWKLTCKWNEFRLWNVFKMNQLLKVLSMLDSQKNYFQLYQTSKYSVTLFTCQIQAFSNQPCFSPHNIKTLNFISLNLYNTKYFSEYFPCFMGELSSSQMMKVFHYSFRGIILFFITFNLLLLMKLEASVQAGLSL